MILSLFSFPSPPSALCTVFGEGEGGAGARDRRTENHLRVPPWSGRLRHSQTMIAGGGGRGASRLSEYGGWDLRVYVRVRLVRRGAWMGGLVVHPREGYHTPPTKRLHPIVWDLVHQHPPSLLPKCPPSHPLGIGDIPSPPPWGGFGMTPGCVAVCSCERPLATHHLPLPFPWTLCLHTPPPLCGGGRGGGGDGIKAG